MKEKVLITSFFVTMSAGSAISYWLLNNGWREGNPIAASKIETRGLEELVIVKMGLTAVLIGTYALSARLGSRWEYPTRKALQISNVIMWGVVAWNTAKILSSSG